MRSDLPAVFVIVLSAACLGTTYVIKEGEVEVGRWEQDDGSEEVKVVENSAKNPAPEGSTAVSQPAKPDDTQRREEAASEVKRWAAVREERTHLEFRQGMTREEVEAAASRAKVKRYSKYTEHDSSGGETRVYWVFEYRYKTENFNHTEKVYFKDWKVVRSEHSVEKR